MATTQRLDAYRFHERAWASYDALSEGFEWTVPARFNIAAYCCDRWAEARPDAPALIADSGGEPETVTYADLDARASRLARFLREAGVARGDRVGVNAPQCVETAVAHLACWKLGAVSVPLSTLFGSDAIRYRLADAGAVAAVVHPEALGAYRKARADVDTLATTVVIDSTARGSEVTFGDVVGGRDPGFEATETDAEDDAVLIYTSGTTGDPKGVRHAHRMLLGHLPLFLTTFCNLELRDDDTFWTPSEWAWIASLFDVVVPACYYGRTVVVDETGGAFEPSRAFDVLDRHGVTNFFAPPTALRMMMQTDREVDSVRVVASGGESLGERIAAWAAESFGGAVVHEGYGQTEANMIVGDCTALAESREGYIGRPGPGHEVAILDDDGERLPADEVGEIAVRYDDDPVCFREYWNDPETTAAKVQDGWLLTEDLGRMDADSYLAFEARKDDVIISGGYRIGPVEIEESLAGHPAVADAAVIGVPDEERGEVPKAFVVLTDGYASTDETRDRLREHVRERLAQYEYPREIEFRTELPTTATGKLRRASLE